MTRKGRIHVPEWLSRWLIAAAVVALGWLGSGHAAGSTVANSEHARGNEAHKLYCACGLKCKKQACCCGPKHAKPRPDAAPQVTYGPCIAEAPCGGEGLPSPSPTEPLGKSAALTPIRLVKLLTDAEHIPTHPLGTPPRRRSARLDDPPEYGRAA